MPSGDGEAPGGGGYGGYGGGFNYGFSGMGTTPGLSVGNQSSGGWGTGDVGDTTGIGGNYGFDTGPGSYGLNVGSSSIGQVGMEGSPGSMSPANYGFDGLGTDQGFNFGGYDIGGDLGGYIGSGTYADAANMPADYSLGDMFSKPKDRTRAGNPNLGFTGMGQQGMRATADRSPGYTLSRGTPGLGIMGDKNGTENSGWNHPAVKTAIKIMGLIPATRPLASAAGLAQGMMTNPTQTALSRANPLAGTAFGVASSDDPTRAAMGVGANMVGSNIGYGVAGPVGAAAAGMGLSGLVDAGMARARADQTAIGPFGSGSPAEAGRAQAALGERPQGDSNDNLWKMAGLAGQLYGGYRGMGSANGAVGNANATQQALQGQMGSLAGMYAPDSPYAKQLAQQLARKDAASGRNSQYGNRAVELQARLAALAPTVANSMSNLAGASTSANTQGMQANQNQQVNYGQILSMLADKKNRQDISSAWGDLKGLFTSDTPPLG